MTTSELEKFLYAKIPLARHLGSKIKSIDENRAVVSAPLSKNRNHMGTGFGGSLQALLILSAYGWLYQRMQESNRTCHLILQECTTQFLKPVNKNEIIAICEAPKSLELKKFFSTFDKKGIARIELNAAIHDECVLVGRFVAKKSTTNKIG